MADNKAKELLWPTNSDILARFVFLYVGQGSSTIILAKDGEKYKSILVDINLDSENDGVNVPMLISDLLDRGDLDIFVNTHPHDDHLKGIIELANEVSIQEVWHSGHKPSRKYNDAYKDLKKIIEKVRQANGNNSEVILEGSKDEKSIGEVFYYILSPAKYVTEEVSDEDPDTRYRRIHEQCVVLKFGIGKTWCMIPGDADRDAFEKHITKYHKERLGSVVLAASHHGSRTFFRYDENDDPYLEALDTIDPKYVTISAPKQSESKHDHPHEDALKLYSEKVGSDNVLHTGQNRYCYIFDIFLDGTYSKILDDSGEVTKAYPIKGNDNGGKKGQSFTERKKKTIIPTTPARYA
ncbi:MAG: competence protein ComEC [Planctomycetes bacterium]|nr:competence protein ComEC [Planctomycetota bacterium]